MYRSNTLLYILILLLTLRISSYFTLFPDSLAMTQVVKAGLRVSLTIFSFLLLKSLREKDKELSLVFSNLTPLLLYCGYLFLGLLSVFWASLPHYALLQLSMIIEALFFAWFYFQLVLYYNALSADHARFSLLFGRTVMVIALSFLIGLAVDPDLFYRQTHGGEVSRLGGSIINPNELGLLAVLGAVMAYTEILRRHQVSINMFIIAVCVGVLLLTQSRSSLMAFLLITSIYILRNGNMKLIFLAIIGAIVLMPILIQAIIVKQGDLQEVFSFTGRLPFWSDLLNYGFPKRPILGFGFMCIAEGDYFHSIHSYSAKMTHNSFIQVLLNLGLVGAFICFLQIVAMVSVMLKSKKEELKWLAWMMLIPLVINSVTEFGIFGESNYGIQFYHFIILFFVVEVVKRPEGKSDEGPKSFSKGDSFEVTHVL